MDMIKCAKAKTWVFNFEAIDEFLILKENSCSVFTANSCCEQNKKFFFSNFRPTIKRENSYFSLVLHTRIKYWHQEKAAVLVQYMRKTRRSKSCMIACFLDLSSLQRSVWRRAWTRGCPLRPPIQPRCFGSRTGQTGSGCWTECGGLEKLYCRHWQNTGTS